MTPNQVIMQYAGKRLLAGVDARPGHSDYQPLPLDRRDALDVLSFSMDEVPVRLVPRCSGLSRRNIGELSMRLSHSYGSHSSHQRQGCGEAFSGKAGAMEAGSQRLDGRWSSSGGCLRLHMSLAGRKLPGFEAAAVGFHRLWI